MRSGIAIAVAVTMLSAAAHAAEVLRDPTRPDTLRAAAVVSAARYRINAIIVSDERRIAIVNGRRVGVGDQVDGAKVVSIEPRSVVLDVDGSPRTLHLRQGGMRAADKVDEK